MNSRLPIQLLSLILILYSAVSYSQNTVLIPPGQLGVLYNKSSENFNTDSLLKPGKHLLQDDLGIYILDTKERKVGGRLPVELKDNSKINFEFNINYSLKEANIGKFVNIFRDDRYRFERSYLVPKIEKLLFEHVNDLDLNDLTPKRVVIISEKIKTDFNKNPKLNQYFTLSKIELWFKTDQ